MTTSVPLKRSPWPLLGDDEYLTATGPDGITAECYVPRGTPAYAAVAEGRIVVIRHADTDELLAEAHPAPDA